MTGNGGGSLLREADRLLGLTMAVARGLADGRQRGKVRHHLRTLLRQRLYGLALGYEDLNHHDELRHDLALQTAVGRDSPLASAATLCRFENQAGESWFKHIQEVLIETCIASHRTPPEEVSLDFDATDDLVHGEQIGRAYQAYDKGYCFPPLYVFAGRHPLVACLREGKAGQALRDDEFLKLLVARLRRAWPGVQIVMRADFGHWPGAEFPAVGTVEAVDGAPPSTTRPPARRNAGSRNSAMRPRRGTGSGG